MRELLAARRDWLAGFVREQAVQTNEVQRCFALLPAFLDVAGRDGRPLDLLELGPSAGLNLLWDRYRYVYAAGAWGPEGSPVELGGEERRPVPGGLLGASVEVVRRRGVDLAPVDVTRPEGRLLLECFLWPDQAERRARLRRAIELLRAEPRPPELRAGDYVALLPELLADRVAGALTVVFQTASTQYLHRDDYARLRAALASAGDLAWVSTLRHPETQERRGYELELWQPPAEPRRVAAFHYHGGWLEWRG